MKIYLLTLYLLLLCMAGVAFRFVGLNWDRGFLLHPDERFVSMVTQDLTLPAGIREYLDTASSPFNPHNRGYGFFVYGTFPLLLTKYLAQFNPEVSVLLLGRLLSAFADTAVILLLFLIGRRVFGRFLPGLIASAAYSLSVLPIQLSHFYAVDTFMVFFLVAAFYFLLIAITSRRLSICVLFFGLTGIFLAFAIASKVSAVIFAVVVFVGLIFLWRQSRSLILAILAGVVFVIAGYFSLRFTLPYLFADNRLITFSLNPKVLENWQQLQNLSNRDAYFPPAVQWFNVRPAPYVFENLTLWGLGIPLAIIVWLSLLYSPFVLRRHPLIALPLVAVMALGGYQLFQTAQPVRYYYPLFPFFALLAGFLIYWLFRSPGFRWLSVTLLLLLIIWPASFAGIYIRPHSRITASYWIYQYIPWGSILACEHWDDCIPLPFGSLTSSLFTHLELPLYGPDTRQKWQDLSGKLSRLDYILTTSNRLYGSINSVPEKYPVTIRYYDLLFSGGLGFTKVSEFTSRPNIPLKGIHTCLIPPFIHYGSVALPLQECPLPGISFVDDYADETFTVYDHPKVIIFQNTGRKSQDEIFSLLSPPDGS
ncbi:hypothetical protein A2972_02160 [Candidatus Amesbacteria bacterium RIFCSPLOWO2_01_FULL_47_33]|uniref:Glycosyltransferase RgtA/B/C/D-like domain-containing protein n=1 Tax=Candidatus Amesbacteria bacterium RIFCSPLOWO2_01_FULL_47_33 TaxID=1797258 RepID=A0A1F4Z6V4_9BACT|nr:MAG: hypothetical protein A2972_02160 [Candidatus Amesbacteria bacterium RIFCSPLOWO2_01_FULL_47_33]